ncbi:putative feruloyl esterase B precursor [Aspergillus sclerotioniger CBS 115572]|uniref:Carboxylic ester hydrolase n=1 Tax=Aspergillus sclerotioniger CBS 115572 TaxID=1450535 RepID=A0A317WZC3_9EURO|nr:putative feruloyl esterase B precursor [Aspergillus sclerotioniger CBS 115572]PWY89580.1 putative feruloyl esterase B precursor [Aspergillus sclerotioniger CBS 115572]
MVVFARTLLALSAIQVEISSASRCSSAAIEKPDLVGASILDIQAQEAHNFSAVSLGPGNNEGGRYTISFCNITVTHTHPGWNDTVHTQVRLPLEGWNGRFQGLGGGGYSTGFGATYMTYAVAQGFASASTDGGLTTADGSSTIPTDLSWALISKGNVDWPLLHNYATKATNDMAVIGQQITKSYYQKPANYSYFAGCSGGGRQALMMAQQYPDVFDGILAVAPAINLQTFIPAGYWPSRIMHETDVYPSPCEINAFTEAAVKICDRLDGVEDGIISDPDRCYINATHFVIEAAWSGSRSVSEQYGWFGVNKDADISSYYISTTCSANSTCSSARSDLFGNWFKYLVAKDSTFATNNMTEKQFFDAMHSSLLEYTSLVGNTDPDLSSFKASGGKLITWHGLADEVIPPKGTVSYYEEVLKADPDARDYHRFFEALGVAHCYGGPGPVPNGAMSQLVEWVENDQAPAVLHATRGSNNTARDLCPYPLRQTYIGGDFRNATSFTCV